MDQEIKISYITTTKNKIPYLKNRMEKLLAQKIGDEEILVADGASADGTKEYLEELKKKGGIDFYSSEPDYGESHALNKLFLIARGELIKIITDDDVFSYESVLACKKFMLEHPEIDLIGSEGGSQNKDMESIVSDDPLEYVRAINYSNNYRQWQKNHTPFSFCGLGIMFRRSSLPVIGLWNLSFRAADAEFSFRTTAGKANIAWYTGYSFINVSNPKSVSLVYKNKIKNEMDRLNKFYLNKDPDSLLVEKMRAIKNKIYGLFRYGQKKPKMMFQQKFQEITEIGEKWLEIKNRQKKPEFIWKK